MSLNTHASDFERVVSIDAVGGEVDVLVAANPDDGVQMSITDADGEVMIFAMNRRDALAVASALESAAQVVVLRQPGGAA